MTSQSYKNGLHGGLLGMRASDGQAPLSGVPRFGGGSVQQERSAEGGFEVLVQQGKPDEQRPSVVTAEGIRGNIV